MHATGLDPDLEVRRAHPVGRTRTIAPMPRRAARTDPPPDAVPAAAAPPADAAPAPGRPPAPLEHDAQAPAIAIADDDPDLVDADLREPGSDASTRELTNGDLARIFHEIGDMLEVKGELVFKTVAYHRAADAIGRSPVDLVAAHRGGTAPKIPGVGAAISDKIEEIATTGRMAYYDKLIAEVPPSLVDLLRIPGLGPKTVRQIWLELGILSMEDLRQAAEAGTLRGLKGLSARTEQLILEGIARLEATPRRMLLPRAELIIDGTIDALLAGSDEVLSIEPAGSFRRKLETIGDLDLLAETTDGPGLIERFTNLGIVDHVINKGAYKAAVQLLRGPQVDLMVMTPRTAGTYRIHFTGSKEHNVRLRERARDRGWSLSEKGFLRIGDDGEPLPSDDAELRTFATEHEAYAFLGLPYIEPELREDHGEIEAALAGTLPSLVTLADLTGDLHSHSDWSDGTHSIEVMAEAARRRGHAYQVLTDHSQSLAIARGLTPDRVEEQRAIIAALNERYAREEADGDAPPETPPEGFRLLHGCELEIRADGALDYDDDLLAGFDVVVASVHVSRRQSKAELTQRTLNGIRSPHVDVIAHPSGRMIGVRDDLDLDWDAVYAEAARTGTVLEMNGSPHRLDLAVERARRAISMGCLLSVDSDAHKTAEFDHLRWGVTQARRAWVEPVNLLNTRSRAEVLEFVAGKPGRV
jgi:DNA polymerase (family 10)